MNTKLLIIVLLFVAIIAGLNFFTLMLGIRAHDDLENSKNENIGDMSDNWSRAPITAFGECNDTNKELTNAFWDGIVKGCDVNGGGLTRDSCPQQERSGGGGGFEIAAIDPIRLTKWKGIEFCGQTLGNYLSLNIVSGSESCPSGTKKCGIIDSLDNILCVDSTADCPITSIKMTSTAPPQGSSFKTGENVYLEYSKEPVEGNIPIQFKVSEGKICADLSYRDIKREPYFLETFAIRKQCENTIAKVVFNEEFTSLDVNQLRTFYQNNGIIDILTNIHLLDLSGYDIPVYLLSRPYIGLTKACRDQLKADSTLLQKLKDSEASTDEAQDFTYGLKVTAIVICSIIMVASLAIGILTCHRKSFIIVASINSVLVIVGTIVLIILGIVGKGKVEEANIDIGFIASENCSDTIINSSVETFISTISASSDDLTLFIVMNVISLIFYGAGVAAMGFIILNDIK